MRHLFRPSTSVRFVVLALALLCVGSLLTFRTYSHSEKAALNADPEVSSSRAPNSNPAQTAETGCPTPSFTAARDDFGTGIGPTSVAVGDFNGDGKLDLAVANFSSNTVSILLGTGTGSFGAKTDFGTGSGPRSVAVGDFNGDGKLDLVVANFRSNTVSILLNTGPIGFSLGFDSPTVTAQQGTTIRVTVNINRIAGFTGNVTVTPPDPFEGINPKPPSPISRSRPTSARRMKRRWTAIRR